MNQKQIPTSNSKEDIKAREKIIINFYQEWKRNNPSQRLYNLDLKDYINIRYISIVETVEHSSKNYLSTLAVLQLDCILRLAKQVKIVNTKQGDKNQNQFEKMIKWNTNLLVSVRYL